MKENIIIRADGGSAIGMGHVVRCLALAEMLKETYTIFFAIQEPSEFALKTINSVTQNIIHLPATNDFKQDAGNFITRLKETDIIVLDGYQFQTEYQKIIKDKGCKLVCIDDLHSWHHLADVILNYAEGVNRSTYSVEPYTKIYLGLEYVLLRPVFLLQNQKIRKIVNIKKIFLNMGAADIENNTFKFTQSLIRLEKVKEIHLMLSTVNPNLQSLSELIKNNQKQNIHTHFDVSAQELKNLLIECDLAICPASGISLECCATGIPLISGYSAMNQYDNLIGMQKHNTLINFESFNELNVDDISNKIEKLINNPFVFNELVNNQKKMIDGKSPDRIREIFRNLSTEKLHFRFANENDSELYFKWTNDPLVRSNSYNQEKISYQNHIKWFQNKLSSSNCFFYLFLNDDNHAVGQVRIDRSGNETVIGISIDENFRGKGLASVMLKTATEDYLQKNPSALITAYIKIENTSSYHSFRKAGFGDEETVTEQGIKSYKLYKKLKA